MIKLIFGCGYLGRRVARRWLDAGDEVYAVSRSAQRAVDFADAGMRPIVADVTSPASLRSLPVADTVLYAVGYDRSSGKSLQEVYVQGLAAALAALPAGTGRFLYVSSTGVYGATHGDTYDEDSPCHPEREGGRACLAAERILQTSELAERAIILRMAGLYGPGRIPRRQEIAAGLPLAVPVDGYLNLIHVDDAVSAVVAADARATPPRTYIVSDGHPVIRRAYYEELAHLLAGAPPKFAPPADESAALARSRVDKRVSNARLLRELEVPIAYPSYREGLAAIVAAENNRTPPTA